MRWANASGLRNLIVDGGRSLAETSENRRRPPGTALPSAATLLAIRLCPRREQTVRQAHRECDGVRHRSRSGDRYPGGPRHDELAVAVSNGIDDLPGGTVSVD